MSLEPILNLEALIEKVHSGFAKKFQKQISLHDIRSELNAVHLADPPARPVCHLSIVRLEISGSKTLANEEHPLPIDYAQDFGPGVNVLLIEDNDVGKSSILKTIRFALTGDDDDYDADVKKWITNIRLWFSINDEQFLIAITCSPESENGLGVLYEGPKGIELHDDPTKSRVVFRAPDKNELQESLRRFFFDKIGLSRLAWSVPGARDQDSPSEAGTTWLTYFQALQIPDGSDKYLLCDKEHSFGNQEGLIFSTFLGLHLVEQLNWLGVEASKQSKLEKSTADERKSLQSRLADLEKQETEVKDRLRKMKRDLAVRRKKFVEEGFQNQITAVQEMIRDRLTQEESCQREIADVAESLSFLRSRETQIKELIALKLHFTGLNVSLCPNCDSEVSTEELEREQNEHLCRLCNKPANDATPDEIAVRQSEAEQIAAQISHEEGNRKQLRQQAEALRSEVVQLRKDVEDLEASAKAKLTRALPTEQEDELRDTLLREVGQLSSQISSTTHRLKEFQEVGAFDESKRRILKKARDILQKEASRRNKELLESLSCLTQEVARQIGAESITDVTCSELGTVKLTKHGEEVRFTGIKNQGERMRLKLAFFLAMMRLGCKAGFGRHPGFLLVDQPGSAEMVPEDFRALAAVLHSIDEADEEHIQILCFTARPEFSDATRQERVYGAQSGKFAF
ncbi:hypothetical protein AB1L42_22620 [Thalassoglobus sp. JC818]|uniref:hypothetical protein n=1 Tax=Thalassoglobus sp. JC818 TaxID=3232136 RepID=UPI00345AE459